MSTNKKATKATAKAKPKKVKDKAERNRDYQTSDEYKAHRKARYENDPDYRERCIANSRAQAERRIAPLVEEYAREVKAAIKRRKSIGAIREVGNSNELTFTIIELSDLICRPAAAVRLWVNAGRFPAPPHALTKITGIYTERQALAICDAMLKHMRTKSAHLTRNRTDAILALHEAVR